MSLVLAAQQSGWGRGGSLSFCKDSLCSTTVEVRESIFKPPLFSRLSFIKFHGRIFRKGFSVIGSVSYYKRNCGAASDGEYKRMIGFIYKPI